MKTGIDFKVTKGKKSDVIIARIYGARLSFAYLNEPFKNESGELKYRAHFLVPKDMQGVDEIKKAIIDMGAKAFSGKPWESAVLKDGDKLAQKYIEAASPDEKERVEKSWAHYRGMWVFSAIQSYDETKKLEVSGDCYSGAYAAAVLAIMPYVYQMKSGIHAYINGVAFQADGERLGGQKTGVAYLELDPLESAGNKAEAAAVKYEDDVPF